MTIFRHAKTAKDEQLAFVTLAYTRYVGILKMFKFAFIIIQGAAIELIPPPSTKLRALWLTILVPNCQIM